MKILLTNKDCNIGGTETFALALAQALRSAGHTCELFFFSPGPFAHLLPADCAAHFGGLADCLRLVAQRQFEIVHATCAEWAVGIQAVRQLGAKLIITNHYSQTLGWTSQHCDAYTSVSRWLAETQQPHTDLPVQLVYNGIDLARFHPGETPAATTSPIIAWVGRGTAVAEKRLERFAALAPALRRAGLRIWLAEPDGPQAVGARLPAAAAALQTAAEFWQAVPPAAMPDFYRAVAASGGCLVTTSAQEAFGLALAEAQACGCPVLGPAVGAIREIVRPEHGGVLYAPNLATEALAALIVATVQDAPRLAWRRVASAAFVRRQFSRERMAREYLRVYQVTARPPLRSRAAWRARWHLSPLLNWPEYLNWRWPVGLTQFETSQQLAAQQVGPLAGPLAAAAARAALAMCPSLFLRPRRLAHLLKTQLPWLVKTQLLWPGAARSGAEAGAPARHRCAEGGNHTP
jgi:glycosyltransferase involved in cell wall biosynthesis